MKSWIIHGLIAAAMLAGPAAAAYPERPITYIVPFSPGGGSDVAVRTWQPFMETCLGPGASIVIQNRPGAGGEIGFGELATAAPDGYTLGNLNFPNMPQGAITGTATYTIDSFDYLANIFGSNVTFTVRKDSPVSSLQELVAWSKERGRPISVGVSGIGSDDHLLGLQFAKVSGLNATFIPFGGTADARNSLIGGHVDVTGMSPAEAIPFQDQLKVIGFAADARSANLPDVPTFKEQGFDVIGVSLHLIGAPKGVPAEARSKLEACFEQVKGDPAFLDEVQKRSQSVQWMSGEDVSRFVRTQTEILEKLWTESPWK